VHQGDEDLVQLLLDSGSDIHVRDIEDVTPLHLSIRQANVSMVQKLLRYLRRDHSTPTPKLITSSQ
jgi:ankyrin repeat protein